MTCIVFIIIKGGDESRMPIEIIRGMATVKKCAAMYNKDKGKMEARVAGAIADAADEGKCLSRSCLSRPVFLVQFMFKFVNNVYIFNCF